MALPESEVRFSGPEIEALDQALTRIPREHMQPPLGLRELTREPEFEHDGQTWPTVMATYRSAIGSATLYDGAFFGMLGELAPDQMLPRFAIFATIGASLAADDRIYGEWCRISKRTAGSPASVLLFEKDQIERSLAFGPDELRIDLAALPAGVDFAVAYAAFLTFPEHLRRGMPVIHQHLFGKIFDGKTDSDTPRSAEDSAIMRIVRA